MGSIFTWIDFYQEFADKLLPYKNNRQELIAKGREQRKLFSWDQTAQRLWDCVMKSIE